MSGCPGCGDPVPVGAPACPGCGLPAASPPEGDERLGTLVAGKYEIVERIGEGATGWVYRAVHRRLESSVAIKIMKASLTESSAIRQRFEREAQASSRLNQPHIISVLDYGVGPDGLPYLVTEFIHGETLDALVATQGALPPGRALHLVDQILEALEEAHAHGVIHRDLKPANIMRVQLRSGADFVKVLDFGIAKVEQAGAAKLTVQGTICGTPAYMAPEQIRGRDATPETDLYACGTILYELLTGRLPFPSASLVEVLTHQLHERPPRPSAVAPEHPLPVALEDAVLRALEKEPGDRYATAAAFRGVLRDLRAALPEAEVDPETREGRCPAGHRIKVGSRFCPECGQRLAETPTGTVRQPPTMTSRPAPEGGPDRPSEVRPGRVRPARRPSGLIEVSLDFPLVGRGQESQVLSDFLHGPAPALELVGPVGSGRSQLLEVLCGSSARRWTILRLGPDPDLVPTPWYPIRCALAGVLDLASLCPRAAALEQAGRTAGLTGPETSALADLFQVQRTRETLEPADRRRAIRDLALRLLRGDGRPRLLVADDVDDYDAGSRDLVLDLARESDGEATKVAVVSRSPFLSPDTMPVTLDVGPLAAEGVASLCEVVRRFRPDLPADLPTRLAEATAGNVLHVLQLLRLLHEGGTPRPGPLPDVLVERMGLLPPAARRALQGLSVLGLMTTTTRLAALDGGTPVPEDALELLVRRGFVHRAPGGALFITHPLVSETIRESIPAEPRRRYHAAAMERTEPDDDRIVEHALHAEQAALGEPALRILRRAAAYAEERLDDALAADLLRRALNLARWELLLDEDEPTCTALEVDLGVALSRTADRAGARMVLKAALTRPGLAADARIRARCALEALE